MPETAQLARSQEDFARLGLNRTQVEPWENGMRTDGGPGSYEWWYLDACLKGGVIVVAALHTKHTQAINDPFAPYLSIMVDRPGGERIERRIAIDPAQFSAESDDCEIRLGSENGLWRLPDHPEDAACVSPSYGLWFEDDNLLIDLVLHSQSPAWRPATGHFLFGEEKYFAWLAAVPHAKVDAYIRLDGKRQFLRGTGYHDHNWGNAPVGELMRGWDWYRGAAGRNAVLAAQLYPQETYGAGEIPIFMLSQNGRLVVDNPNRIIRDTIGETTSFEYTDSRERHIAIIRRERTLVERPLTQKIGQAALAGELDATTLYRRFSGTMSYEVYATGSAMLEDARLGCG